MKKKNNDKRILAIDPSSRGFGYVVMEGEHRLLDWGNREASGPRKNQRVIKLVRLLIEEYEPHILVLEDTVIGSCRRRSRIRELLKAMEAQLSSRELKVKTIAKANVHKHFSMQVKPNQRKLAESVARLLPELSRRLPPLRKPWMSEDPRTRLFGAAALGLTHYDCNPSVLQKPST